VNRIASSFTIDRFGVTSLKLAAGGLVESSNVNRETCWPDMYMMLPVCQLAPIEGSPADGLPSPSRVW
jgi:hypothetical protein